METTQRRLKRRLLKQQSSAAQKAAANRKVSALRQKAAARRKAAAKRKAAARKRDAARMRLAQSRSAQNVPSALSVLIARQAKVNNTKKDIAIRNIFF